MKIRIDYTSIVCDLSINTAISVRPMQKTALVRLYFAYEQQVENFIGCPRAAHARWRARWRGGILGDEVVRPCTRRKFPRGKVIAQSEVDEDDEQTRSSAGWQREHRPVNTEAFAEYSWLGWRSPEPP